MILIVFTYHRVLPRPHPDALEVSAFERQLDYIEENFSIVSPEQALEFIEGKTLREEARGRPLAMLSFDDGWLDNWLFATPILKKRRMKAALALSAGFLHDGKLRKNADDVSEAVLTRHNLDAEKIALTGDTQSYLSREEVRAMHDSGCWSIEAHGTRHAKNARGISFLSAPEHGIPASDFENFLRADLENCANEIRAITDRSPKMMFWPWGQYSALSVKTAKTLGFAAQFSTAKGAIVRGGAREIFPRVNAAANQKKFRRNAFIFRHPLLSRLHDVFAHTETLCFE